MLSLPILPQEPLSLRKFKAPVLSINDSFEITQPAEIAGNIPNLLSVGKF